MDAKWALTERGIDNIHNGVSSPPRSLSRPLPDVQGHWRSLSRCGMITDPDVKHESPGVRLATNAERRSNAWTAQRR
jgi:hypothetical protein